MNHLRTLVLDAYDTLNALVSNKSIVNYSVDDVFYDANNVPTINVSMQQSKAIPEININFNITHTCAPIVDKSVCKHTSL